MAKYINKFKDENEYNDKKMSLDYPSINYVESLDEIVWLKEMPPFKYYITDLDGNIIYSKPFDENDTTLHQSDFAEFNNAWYNGASYGDFVIGEGITGGDAYLFFNSKPSYVKIFSVERLVIPSTWDNRIHVKDPETGEPIPGEYIYCDTYIDTFGEFTRRNNEVCGINPKNIHIEKGAQIWSLFGFSPIEEADLSNFEYDGQNTGTIFVYARNLKSAVLPSGITSLGCDIFEYCSNLSSVTIPDTVTSIGNHAFDGCSSLSAITIPSGVTSIDDSAFRGCSSLSSLTIPNSVTSIGEHAFNDCRLSALTIPSSVTEIGAYAFYGSEAEFNPFEYILFEGTTPATLQPSYRQFDNNTGATYPLYVPQSAVNTYKSADVWVSYASRISGYTYEWQTVQDEYRCDNGDKYAVEEKVINIESGTSYIHTGEYRQGSLIESGSTDCAYADVRLYHFEAESDSPRFTVPMTFDTSYKYTMEFTPVDWPSEQEWGGDDNYYGGIIGQENNNERGLELFKLDNGWGYPEYRTSAGFNGYDLSTNNDGSPTFGAYRFYDGVKATVTLEGVQDGAKITVENEGYQTYTATSTNYLNSSLSDGDTFNIFMFCNEYDYGNGFNPPANMIFHSFTVRDSNDNLVYEYNGYDNQDGTYSLIDTVSKNTYSIPSIYTTDPDEP